MKHFDLKFETSKTPETVHRELLASWTGELAAVGFTLTSQSTSAVTYSRRYRSWAVILLAVILFPIGLLFLLITSEATITATIDRDDAGDAVLLVNGDAPKDVRRSLELMTI